MPNSMLQKHIPFLFLFLQLWSDGTHSLFISSDESFFFHCLQVETAHSKQSQIIQSCPIKWHANQWPASAMTSPRLCTTRLARYFDEEKPCRCYWGYFAKRLHGTLRTGCTSMWAGFPCPYSICRFFHLNYSCLQVFPFKLSPCTGPPFQTVPMYRSSLSNYPYV